MNSDVFRILYCSRNLIEGAPALQFSEIDQILTTARTNNSLHQVTGALLFNSGYFAQVLEGPRLAIERIFEKIQRDQRHGEVTVLESGQTARRDFPDWSMAYVQPPSEAHATDLATALDQAMLHPAASGSAVLDLLRALVIQED